MATITFHANNENIYTEGTGNQPDLINSDAGSGLGFFGGGFGISVPVSQYQDSTYVTDANGTTSGIKCSNLKYSTDTTGYIQGEVSDTVISGVPNIAAPLNVRFENADAVRVQNCKLRIFDRQNIDSHASGVVTQVYEIRHPHPVVGVDFDANKGPLKFRGVTGDNEWEQFSDGFAMADYVMTPGPGPSGLNTSSDDPMATGDGTHFNYISKSGESCRANRHDWYVALSASPNSIGSKTDFGLYFTLEYL